MQVAVSAALDLPIKRRRTSRPTPAVSMAAVQIEVAREIQPLSFVDLDVSRVVVEDVVPRTRSETIARVMNVTVAILAAIILAPLILLVALAVKLTSPGPVFYTQVRVGVDRRLQGEWDVRRRGLPRCGKRCFVCQFLTAF